MPKHEHEHEPKVIRGLAYRPHARHVEWLIERAELYDEWKKQQQKDDKKRPSNKDK